jgi:hypothetical protein
MGTVTVKYGRLVDLAQALKCRRCEGGGRERYGPDAGQTCPHCDGTGERPDGWGYQDGGYTLRVGDVVEVPPTRRSVDGRPQLATVVALRSDYERPFSRVLRVVE